MRPPRVLSAFFTVSTLLAGCALREPAGRYAVYEGPVIFAESDAWFYPPQAHHKLGWKLQGSESDIRRLPGLRQYYFEPGAMYHLRCVGTPIPTGKREKIRDTLYQPHSFYIREVLELRGAHRTVQAAFE